MFLNFVLNFKLHFSTDIFPGQPVKGRFEQLFEMCMSHKDDHVLIFNDLHFLMTYLGSGKRSEAETFVRSLREEAG